MTRRGPPGLGRPTPPRSSSSTPRRCRSPRTVTSGRRGPSVRTARAPSSSSASGSPARSSASDPVAATPTASRTPWSTSGPTAALSWASRTSSVAAIVTTTTTSSSSAEASRPRPRRSPRSRRRPTRSVRRWPTPVPTRRSTRAPPSPWTAAAPGPAPRPPCRRRSSRAPCPGGTSIGAALDGLDGEATGIRVDGSVSIGQGPAAQNTSIAYVIDVSGSAGGAGGPCGDVNADRRSNTILDCELAAALKLQEEVEAAGTVDKVAVITFSSGASALDLDPTAGHGDPGVADGGQGRQRRHRRRPGHQARRRVRRHQLPPAGASQLPAPGHHRLAQPGHRLHVRRPGLGLPQDRPARAPPP